MPLSGRGGCDLYGMPSPLILAPLERFGDMPECCTVGRWRQKYGGWAGYDNRHLVAAQLAIDAVGGVATPDRNQEKFFCWPLKFCMSSVSRNLQPSLPSKMTWSSTKNEDPTADLCLGADLLTCRAILLLTPLAEDPSFLSSSSSPPSPNADPSHPQYVHCY